MPKGAQGQNWKALTGEAGLGDGWETFPGGPCGRVGCAAWKRAKVTLKALGVKRVARSYGRGVIA